MTVPVCRECEALRKTIGTITGHPIYACSELTMALSRGMTMERAYKGLPKTSPRWCPLRKANRPDPMRREDGDGV